MSPNPLSEDVRGQCVQRLDALLENSEIITAVLATAKGGCLAAPSYYNGIDTMQIAALSAMLSSVGSNLAAGAPSRGVCICDVKGHPMVVLPVKRMLLSVIGRKGTNMGMVAGVAQDMADKMAERIDDIALSARQQGLGDFQFDADGFTERVLASLEDRKPQPAS